MLLPEPGTSLLPVTDPVRHLLQTEGQERPRALIGGPAASSGARAVGSWVNLSFLFPSVVRRDSWPAQRERDVSQICTSNHHSENSECLQDLGLS